MNGQLHAFALRVYRRLPRRARRAIVRQVSPTFTVGSMCVIERSDGRVLLIRHSYRERWGLPGGLLEKGESPAGAAIREVREEVNLDIALVGEPAFVVDAESRRVDVVFRARPVRADDADAVRPTSVEIVETRWFPRQDFPELQWETVDAFDAVRRAETTASGRERSAG
jgi:8-oxo-dGTP pyrophosphatase MutT (NUDIX family)